MMKHNWVQIIKSIFLAIGAVWLPLEAYEGLSNKDVDLTFVCFLLISFILGLAFFLFDGYVTSGFLKKQIEIKSTGFDTKIIVKFGDYFEEEGWKAVGVNDFFDNRVDNKIVSQGSLHGQIITKFWPNEESVWKDAVNESIKGQKSREVPRAVGNVHRFPLGTTAYVEKDGQNFLFTALTKTDRKTNQTQTDAQGLILATRSLLSKARTVCANNNLILPLMGAGLGRVGLKRSILLDLILTAIFEESKLKKVTDTVTIVLPKQIMNEVNLGRVSKDWN